MVCGILCDPFCSYRTYPLHLPWGGQTIARDILRYTSSHWMTFSPDPSLYRFSITVVVKDFLHWTLHWVTTSPVKQWSSVKGNIHSIAMDIPYFIIFRCHRFITSKEKISYQWGRSWQLAKGSAKEKLHYHMEGYMAFTRLLTAYMY